jgi:hypothetical protein
MILAYNMIGFSIYDEEEKVLIQSWDDDGNLTEIETDIDTFRGVCISFLDFTYKKDKEWKK